MNKKNIVWHEVKENCYMLTSFRAIKDEYMKRLVPTVSFLYITERLAVEWETQYGPIQLWYKAEELNDETQENYIFDYVEKGAHWSQMGADNSGIKEALERNDYDFIFSYLQSWTEGR